MAKNKIDIRHNKRFIIFPILAIVAHFLMSNILYFAVEKLFLDILHIPEARFIKFAYLGEILVYIVLIFIFFPIYKLMLKHDKDEMKTETNGKDSILSIMAGIGVSGVSFIWIMLAEKMPAFQRSLDAMNAGNQNIGGGSLLGGILIAVIAGPLIEEILFRGIVFRSIRKISPAWLTILLSSVLFGAYHMNPVQIVYASFMGAVAGIIYEKKNNLIFPLLVHVANNFMATIQSFAPSGTGEIISIFSLIMILPLGGILYYFLQNKYRNKEVMSF